MESTNPDPALLATTQPPPAESFTQPPSTEEFPAHELVAGVIILLCFAVAAVRVYLRRIELLD